MARDRNPSKLSNWEIRCKRCGCAWLDQETVQQMADHMFVVHRTAQIEVELTWVGKGPAPKSKPRM